MAPISAVMRRRSAIISMSVSPLRPSITKFLRVDWFSVGPDTRLSVMLFTFLPRPMSADSNFRFNRRASVSSKVLLILSKSFFCCCNSSRICFISSPCAMIVSFIFSKSVLVANSSRSDLFVVNLSWAEIVAIHVCRSQGTTSFSAMLIYIGSRSFVIKPSCLNLFSVVRVDVNPADSGDNSLLD